MIVEESGALRRRVAHLIDTVTFDPPGMSPSSILLVRRLADPLPRRLAPHLEAVRADSEWERAARSRLSELHRRAVRPIQGFVSGAADAVVFADQSEMLACLARDIVSGNAAMFWWWRAILRGLPAGMIEALVAAWRRDARYIPAATHLLHARGEAVRVLSSISPAQSWSILQEMAREFGTSLAVPSAVSPIPGMSPQQEPASAESTEKHRPSFQQDEKEPAKKITAPWQDLTFMQALPDSFGWERTALLGVSLLLHRAPQVVRSARFTERFFAWYQSAKAQKADRAFIASNPESVGQASAAQATSGPITISPLRLAEQQESGQDIAAIANDSGEMPVVMAQEAPSSSDMQGRAGKSDHATELPRAKMFQQDWEPGAKRDIQALTRERPQSQTNNSIADEQHVRAASPVESRPAISEPNAILPADEVQAPQHTFPLKAADEEPVPTELGGVLFLVNLLLALKLPESLESEFGIGPVSGWDLLELLARSLLGEREAALANDGIWRVLGQLTGRSPDDPVAAEFQAQPCYRIPPSWLTATEPQSAQAFGVRLRTNHLQLWHQEGFVLADCIIDKAFSKRSIEEECRAYCRIGEHPELQSWRKIGKRAFLGCRNVPESRWALRCFLAFLLPYMRWRLCLALGISNPHALTEMLLLRRGRLHVTRTHVDLVMDLNQATPQVRMSGLDADPGWVPSLGRVIKFSFVAEAWG